MMPEDMAGHTDEEIMQKLYNEDDALSDFRIFSKPVFCGDRK
jgi:hypothetical protein